MLRDVDGESHLLVTLRVWGLLPDLGGIGDDLPGVEDLTKVPLAYPSAEQDGQSSSQEVDPRDQFEDDGQDSQDEPGDREPFAIGHPRRA